MDIENIMGIENEPIEDSDGTVWLYSHHFDGYDWTWWVPGEDGCALAVEPPPEVLKIWKERTSTPNSQRSSPE
jgi:hypothetical protein